MTFGIFYAENTAVDNYVISAFAKVPSSLAYINHYTPHCELWGSCSIAKGRISAISPIDPTLSG